jgi:hypothetical protein
LAQKREPNAPSNPEFSGGFYLYAIKKMVLTYVPLKRYSHLCAIDLNFFALYAIPSGLHPIFTVKSPDM